MAFLELPHRYFKALVITSSIRLDYKGVYEKSRCFSWEYLFINVLNACGTYGQSHSYDYFLLNTHTGKYEPFDIYTPISSFQLPADFKLELVGAFSIEQFRVEEREYAEYLPRTLLQRAGTFLFGPKWLPVEDFHDLGAIC